MLQLFLLIVALGIVAAVAGLIRQWWYGRQIKEGKIDHMPEVREGAAAGCCGRHETCEKDSLLAAVSKEIEYYEDEELDRFRGRECDDYSETEIEEFNEVLTTLRSEEVAGWVRSLQLRGIRLPYELKDDVLLLVGERRFEV
ncbi:phospholipase [Alloprevotella sp. OH1205_COT-284]|uniref:phospholipase n=1 Tax=Alloprevotella sp. OH1205_COT-284 TaxID=2491043 RepID=UPI000F5E7AC0|nr:phospholipase [Alloprevotella sp. OH1205_COT-284]RRD80187.1 phospholipase [Alloprevotella sp. OH1205_COT-284]